MNLREEAGRRRIIRTSLIKPTDDSSKNIESAHSQLDILNSNHSHLNKILLDSMSISKNKVVVNGEFVQTHLSSEEW